MRKPPKQRATRRARPLVISPIPAITIAPIARPMSAKRISRVRLSWFLVGSLFGIAVSFFMNLLVTAVIVPEYEQVVARRGGGNIEIAEITTHTPSLIERAREKLGTSAHASLPQEAVTEVAEVTPAAPVFPRDVTLQVASGDTLVGMLMDNDVPSAEAHSIVAALRKNSEFNPQRLRIGQKISLTLARHETIGDAAAVKELAIKLPNLSTVELERAENGGFSVAAVKAELKDKAYHARGTVRSSLSQAAAEAGINGGAFAEITTAFSYDIDFQREIHPGDKIEALFDKKVTAAGEVGGWKDLRYASLTLLGKKHEIFKYDGQWYDTKGNSVKKSLLRTPLSVIRITSGFGLRRHPILGYSRMHQGVDFGAAQGTPIMAAGDGVVQQRGWVNGYGNFVMIKHNNTYSTAYGHMSRFGKISVGSKVKQGQIIGYVGMTGAATGPHLHYEVRANSHQVNPSAKQFNLASGLTGHQLTAFNAKKTAMSKEMASLDRPAAAKLAATAPVKHQQLASR